MILRVGNPPVTGLLSSQKANHYELVVFVVVGIRDCSNSHVSINLWRFCPQSDVTVMTPAHPCPHIGTLPTVKLPTRCLWQHISGLVEDCRISNVLAMLILHFLLPQSLYDDVMMGTTASQITSLTIVYSTVYSDTDQRKHQSSASLAFVRGIHRGPVNSPHKCLITRKMCPFDDVIMCKTMPCRWFCRTWSLVYRNQAIIWNTC